MLGYDCTVVDGDTEFTLTKQDVVSVDEMKKELISSESLFRIKKNISSVHNALESILYNTHLAVGSDITPEQITEINNIILSLEKNTYNLGSVMSLEPSDLDQ